MADKQADIPNQVIDQNDDKRYFTQMPNILDDLNLSPYAIRVYFRLKRVAGANGSKPPESTRTLAKHCNISLEKTSKVKKELESAGLIKIEEINTRYGPTHIITLVNIWARNIAYYQDPGDTSELAMPMSVRQTNGQNSPTVPDTNGERTPDERSNGSSVRLANATVRQTNGQRLETQENKATSEPSNNIRNNYIEGENAHARDPGTTEQERVITKAAPPCPITEKLIEVFNFKPNFITDNQEFLRLVEKLKEDCVEPWEIDHFFLFWQTQWEGERGQKPTFNQLLMRWQDSQDWVPNGKPQKTRVSAARAPIAKTDNNFANAKKVFDTLRKGIVACRTEPKLINSNN